MAVRGKALFFPRERKRTITTATLSGEWRSNGFQPYSPWSRILSYTEDTLDVNHGYLLPMLRHAVGDVGSFFTSTKNGVRDIRASSMNTSPMRGPVLPSFMTGFNPSPGNLLPLTGGDVQAFGAHAIATVNPNRPSAHLATALGELAHDGLPRMLGTSLRDRASLTRSAGDEYLNVEFGWLPLVSDVRSIAGAIKNSKRILDQYRRDSDRAVRRRYTSPQVVSVKETAGSGFIYPSSANVPWKGSVTERSTTDLWFVGKFRYHINAGSSVYDRFARYDELADKLLGVNLNAETLWQLAPWSWAVDWFSDVGDVMSNISHLGVDGDVMQYGYVMAHQSYECTYHCRSSSSNPNFQFAGECGYTVFKDIKQRVQASPYGFALKWDGLSNTQLAVLAALGITRSHYP